MEKLNKYFDHTLLKADATKEDIAKLCEEAIEYDFYSVCVNSCHAAYARKLLSGSDVKLTCVVGFPLGAMHTEAKSYETMKACEAGADEIDMVMNIGALKDGDLITVSQDIAFVCETASQYGAIVKVIIETCLLTDDEKIDACEIAVQAGAQFVKTSTGFSTGGATIEDIRLMKETVGDAAKIKASGGIRDPKTTLQMIEAGADRIGASASVSIMKDFFNK